MYTEDKTIEERAIEKLATIVKKYGADFRDKTAKINEFPQIDEIERSWEGLQKQSSEVIRDMVNELINNVNERDLIAKKKFNGEPLE